MEYHLIPDASHEWLGISVFILFLLHNILNWRWYSGIFKGKYSIFRIIQTVINMSLWIAMLLCMFSSLCISGYVFSFVDLNLSRIGRAMHLATTIWLFVLASIHFGFHISLFVGIAKRMVKKRDGFYKSVKWICRVLVIGVCAFAVYIFITRAMWEEMFLITEFKWYDYEKTFFEYWVGTLSIMVLFTAFAHYVKQLLIQKNKKHKEIRDG